MKRTVVLALLVSLAGAGAVLAWYSASRAREYQRLIAVGDRSLAKNETFVAIEAYSGAVAIQPNSMLAYLKRGDTYRRRGDLQAAFRDLRQAAALDPTSTRTLELLGDINAEMGRYGRAADHYQHFASLDDRSPRVLYKLALTKYKNRQVASAIEPLRQAIAIDDRFSEAHHLLGLCLRQQKQHPEALRALRRAVEINPAFAAARADLADCYRESGRARERIEQLEALAAIEPLRAVRLIDVALAYARLGRTDAAITTLGRAAERYPDEPSVYTAIGLVWLESAEQRGDRVALSKALQALQAPASRDEATSEALALYGRALFLAGHAEPAVRVLEQATATLPVEPVTFLWLSAAHTRRRDAAAARQALVDYGHLVDEGSEEVLAARVADSLRLQQRLRLTASPDRGRRRVAPTDAGAAPQGRPPGRTRR